MTKEDIIAGLKQAIERGANLEQAKQSFINAGYSSEEVEDSARALSGIPQTRPIPTQPTPPKQITTQTSQPTRIQPPQKKSKLKILIISAFILILLAAALFITFF
jgi:hypothetical protein